MNVARSEKTPERGDEQFVKWIPIMVPFFAVVLGLAAILIGASLVAG